MLKLVIAIVVLTLAAAIAVPAIVRGQKSDPVVAPAAHVEAPITDEAPVEEPSSPPGPVDDLGSEEEESSPPGPIDDLGEERSPPGPIDDLGDDLGGVGPVTSTPAHTKVSLTPPMDPVPDVSASPDAGLPLPRSRTQQALDPRDGPDTESLRTEGDGAARLAATPFDEPIGPRTGIKDRVAGAR